MGWIVLIVIIIVAVRIWLNKNKKETATNNSMSDNRSMQNNSVSSWTKPITADDHLKFFATMGERMCTKNDRALVTFNVYCRDGGDHEEVKLQMIGLNDYLPDDTEAYGYLISLTNGNKNVAECEFSFSNSQGGAPEYYKDVTALFQYISSYAPRHAHVSRPAVELPFSTCSMIVFS